MNDAVHAALTIPILQPWMVPATFAIGALLVVALWAWRGRYQRRFPLFVLAAAAIAVASWYIVNNVWAPFADGVYARAFVWVFILALLSMQVVAGPWGFRSRGRDGAAPPRFRPLSWATAGIASLLVAVLASALCINALYGFSPTLAALLGRSVTIMPWHESAAVQPHTTVPAHDWTPAGRIPPQGQVTTVSVPASDRDFHPRDALIYLPPASLGPMRPQLP